MTFPVSKQVRARNNVSPRPYMLLEEAEPTTTVPVTPVRRQVWEPGTYTGYSWPVGPWEAEREEAFLAPAGTTGNTVFPCRGFLSI